MAEGPNESRFRTSLHGASPEDVQRGSLEWRRCADILDEVSRSLALASAKDQKIGGRTGPALGAAFRRTSTSMNERANVLRKGSMALGDASQVLLEAETAKVQMDQRHPTMDAPAPYQKPVGQPTEEDLQEQTRHQRKVQAYQETYAARERISQEWASRIDEVFLHSIQVMKQIHGEPDRKINDDDDTRGRRPIDVPSTREGRRPVPGGDDHDGLDDDYQPTDPDDPHDPTDPDDHDPGDPHDPTDPDGQGDPGGPQHDGPPHVGGVGPGTIGGIAAGGLIGGLAVRGLRNGGLALPGAVSSTGVRPIGSSGRVGASGPLGRSGAVAPGTPVTRTGAGGRGVTGRGAAGTGSPVGRGGKGGPGGPGGKGTGRGARGAAGGIGTGRGRGKKDEDEQQVKRDLFDDGDDWLDDEGAAPDVLG